MTQSPNRPEVASGTGLLRRWRWPLGISIALVLYALAGFLLAPWLIQRQLPQIIRAELGREAAVERVEVNPFALSLRIAGFKLKDTDGSVLAGLDEFFVNIEASSAIRRAFTVSELRLGAPYLKVVRDRAGDINLLKLVPPAPAAAEPGELPRLIIRKLRLENGVLDLADLGPATPFRTRAGPFSVALDELNTLPNAAGRHDLAITLESGTQITIGGDLVVNPLHASGQVAIKGPAFSLVHRYIKDQLKFDVGGGSTDMAMRFDLRGAQDGALSVSLSDLAVRLSDVRLSAPAAPDFLAWSELRLTGGALRWPANQVSAAGVLLKGLRVKARRSANGDIDVASLLTPKEDRPTAAVAAPASAHAPTGSEPAWKITVAEAALADMALEFTDAAPATPAVLAVTDLDLTLRNVTNEPGARLPLESAMVLGGGGTVQLKGEVTALPEFALDAEIQADGIKLAQVQPYVSDIARVAIRDGALGLDGHLSSDAKEQLAFHGDVRIRDLNTYDQVKKERLLAWRELGVDDLQLSLSGNRATITRVRLEHPFGRIFIARDQSTNIGDLVLEGPPAAAPAGQGAAATPKSPAAGAQPPFRVRIGKVRVRQGEVDFTDLSLPLPFAARIQDMKGEFTTIDTRSSAPSRIQLEGRVDDYGLARVEGRARVSSPTDLADISVLFRNIEMAPLSPYTVKFAGRKIARGKISLDLRYQLDNRKMVGSNKIVIDELELGEKLPNPDAVDLPLGLAVALLKDANGRIDLDMPVTGSLDDPQFGIGSVLWKAFLNLITKVVTSPFRLLGSLIGIDSEELGKIEFSPGRADVLPPEKEKLLRVAEALAKRPELSVAIPVVVDPQVDAAALRTMKMQDLIELELKPTGKAESGRGLEKRTRQVIESLHQRQLPDQPLDALQARFQAPPADDPQGRPRLDELAYLDQLRANLAGSQTVSEEELAALGTSRAAAISAQLTGAGQVPPARVRVSERKDVTARDGAWVEAELGVGGAAD